MSLRIDVHSSYIRCHGGHWTLTMPETSAPGNQILSSGLSRYLHTLDTDTPRDLQTEEEEVEKEKEEKGSWCVPIPALGVWKEEDRKLKVIFGSIARWRSVCLPCDSVSTLYNTIQGDLATQSF